MSNKKLCGYDLNGWSDRAARNWIIDADGEERVGVDQNHVNSAVMRPTVVRTGVGKYTQWIGGAQAALAPHGRGGGWGDVGAPDRRETVHALLTQLEEANEQLTASLKGLASGAKFCAIAVDDHPDRSELLQERLLGAMARGRLGRGLLVWRSVLAVLGSLIKSPVGFAAETDLNIGVIGHVTEGFTLQRLRLRKEAGHRRDLFAPERRSAAKAVESSLGYAGLFRHAENAVAATTPAQRGNWAQNAKSTAALALGATCQPELLRTERGDFFLLTPPDPLHLPEPDLPQGLSDVFTGCDVIIFETLTQGKVRQQLLEILTASLPYTPIALPEDIVAYGALEAARRYSEGEPIYFDYLPQISTIVLGHETAQNYDLIEANETLPAGRVYRSPKPAKFAISSGSSEFLVHLRKELEEWPREAKVELGTTTTSEVPVSLNVEQAPLTGRARLFVEAPMLSRQFTIDWDIANTVEKPWDEIIAEQSIRPVTVPERLVLPCGMEPWLDSSRGPGLTNLLIENDGKAKPDWESLAAKLSARPKKLHCISSDGELPPQVSDETRERLDRITLRAMEHVQDRIDGRIHDDNQSLKFLTWQFRYAPERLPAMLIEAWNARSPLFMHPFVERSAASWILVYQGFGRTCRDQTQERAAFARVFQRPVSEWSYRVETAATAFLLSRSDTAPHALSRRDVEQLACRVLIEFKCELGTDYTRFNYAPFLLAGLLRWRLKIPNALVAGQDPLATQLRDALHRTLDDFDRKINRTGNFLSAIDRYQKPLRLLLDELDGHGGKSNLLRAIYDA